MEWVDVRKELIEEKKIAAEVADKIGEYAMLKGGVELIDRLKADTILMQNRDADEALAEIELLFKYCSIYNLTDKV